MKAFLIAIILVGLATTNAALAGKAKRPKPHNPTEPKTDKPGDPPSPTKPPGPEDPIKLRVFDANRKYVETIIFK
jgi:hypothetical protein